MRMLVLDGDSAELSLPDLPAVANTAATAVTHSAVPIAAVTMGAR
jgi:hypothetical protein